MLVFLAVLFSISVAYQILSSITAARFARKKPKVIKRALRFSQIKPLRHVDPVSLLAVESFLDTRNAESGDFYLCSSEAAPEEWLSRRPQATWLRVQADQSRNGKAATLATAQRYWSGDIFVISDADMICSDDFLEAVLGEFSDPKVGVVTALYRGKSNSIFGLGALLESLCILDFSSSVLVAEKVEGVRFAMGSTMAIRREVLQQIGGFEALEPYLADDFQLGFRSAQKGWKVALAPTVLSTELGEPTLVQALEHQYRWLVTSRVSRPLGHLAFVLTQGLLWAGLICFFSCQLGLSLVLFWCFLRVAFGGLLHRNLASSGSGAGWQVLFLPIKDLIFLPLWLASLRGNKVKWGHQDISVDGEGRIETSAS